MIKLLKKYGVELKLKKCDLFRLIEGQKDTFLEDGFAFKMTNEEEMFKYEVILNGIYNKTKIEGEYKKFVYETQDAIQYLNYEEKQTLFSAGRPISCMFSYCPTKSDVENKPDDDMENPIFGQ